MRRFTLTFDAQRAILNLEPTVSFGEPIRAPN
jgi:hypothetical protein